MLKRILQEVELLRNKYGDLECDPDGNWILFTRFKVPPGWNREYTELLVNIPPGYPSTPPDNFYVPVGFKLANGQDPNAYTEGHPFLERQWGQFSYHSDGGWNPSENVLDGDNLQSFMLKVVDRLREAD